MFVEAHANLVFVCVCACLRVGGLDAPVRTSACSCLIGWFFFGYVSVKSPVRALACVCVSVCVSVFVCLSVCMWLARAPTDVILEHKYGHIPANVNA